MDAVTAGATILNFAIFQDRSNDPHRRIMDGQFMDVIAHGVGRAVSEHTRCGNPAQPTSTTLAAYLLVMATETLSVHILHMHSLPPLHPSGTESPDEAGVIPVPAALEDALSPSGTHIAYVPLPPANVLALVNSWLGEGVAW
jgi:carbon-monoxide dehydrogenase large subunit